MLRIPPAPAPKKPAAVNHHPLGGAAAVGALLGVGVLALTLAGVPVLAWMLLGAVRPPPWSTLPAPPPGGNRPASWNGWPSGAWVVHDPVPPGGPAGWRSIGVIEEVEGGVDGG